jgi:hypothetical protein
MTPEDVVSIRNSAYRKSSLAIVDPQSSRRPGPAKSECAVRATGIDSEKGWKPSGKQSNRVSLE